MENAELNMKISNQKAQYDIQMQMISESCEQRIKIMREDRETLIKHHNEAVQSLQAYIEDLEKQKNEAFAEYKSKMKNKEKEFDQESERIKHANKVMIERLKDEYEEKLERLKKQKEEEIMKVIQFKSVDSLVGHIDRQTKALVGVKPDADQAHMTNGVASQYYAKEELLRG